MWIDSAQQLHHELDVRILSRAEISRRLDALLEEEDCPIAAYRISISQPPPFDNLILGETELEQPDWTESVDLDRQRRFIARCALAFRPGESRDSRLEGQKRIENLVVLWWRGDQRDHIGKILSGQFPELQEAVERTVKVWSRGEFSLAFADLDNFKLFNDRHGEQSGDALIAQCAASLQSIAGPDSIIIHRSGDEFLILSPVVSRGETVAQAADMRRTVEMQLQEMDEAVGTSTVGLSLGLTFVAREAPSWGELELRADRALKPSGVKLRGRVSLAAAALPHHGSDEPEPNLQIRQLRSVALTFAAFAGAPPFANVWLAATSELAAKAAMTEVENNQLAIAFKAIQVTLGIIIDDSQTEASYAVGDEDIRTTPHVSELDALLAVTHGVGRARMQGYMLDRDFDLVLGGHGAKGLQIGGETIVRASIDSDTLNYALPVVPLVRPISTRTPDLIDPRRCILLRIGDDAYGLPSLVFAEVIYVDDRPTMGGGLPDIWEPTVAQLIMALYEHPNVRQILIFGRAEYAHQTIRWLTHSDLWTDPESVDLLAGRLDFLTGRITEAGKRLIGAVSQPSSVEEILRSVVGNYESRDSLKERPEDARAIVPRTLHRKLDLQGRLLGPEDGCRAETAFEAFPIAVEIVRGSGAKEVVDGTGRPFKELVDFRINLMRPENEMIPRYHQYDAEELEAYFKREFISTKGMFAAAFERKGQLAGVLEHVVESVNSHSFTTRRAILVVAHETIPGHPISPMGLVSARIIPRHEAQGVRLDFSFSWRTVEVLVGLPYSLYGSIRYAQHLTELVSGRADLEVRMGDINYLAHSLHMYMDPYTQRIARRIINDDSW